MAADERDAGRRQVLNLGHTIGHALEAVTGYARLRHGEAVSLGLLAALRLSGADQLREQVAGLLVGAGLPVSIGGVDADEVVAATHLDKKRTGARVPFVLCQAPGDVRHGAEAGPRRCARGGRRADQRRGVEPQREHREQRHDPDRIGRGEAVRAAGTSAAARSSATCRRAR